MRLSRLYLWLIAATVVVGSVLLINLQFGVMYMRDADVFVGISGLALTYAVVGLGCAAAYENGKAPILMRSGMIVGMIALACGIVIILTPELKRTMTPMKVFVPLTVWPCLMMISGLLLLLPMHAGWRWCMRAVTFIMLAALALFIAGAYVFYPETTNYWDDRTWRYEERAVSIGAAISLLTAASLATTLIVGIMSALTCRTTPTRPVARAPYWLQCPRCGREQEAMTGDHHCVACNLRTKVQFV